MCTWLVYFVLISVRRSDGGGSNIQSAWPFSTAVTSASVLRPNFCTITSGLPSGCASADQTLKFGFRTSLIWLFGLYVAHLYGPVPAGGICTSLFGVDGGRMNANGTASWSRNSGSAFERWNVTVFAALSATTPFERSQVSGVFRQASAPSMLAYQVPAFGLCLILNSRSKVKVTSLGFSVVPSENLIPFRSVNL